MKKVFISFLTVVVTGVLNAQWFNLNSPTSNYLYSVYFSNYDTGYAVGGNINQSVFLKTVNGGVDWNIQTNTQTKWLYDVVFLNDTTGVACGYDGAMYKTTNAGTSWDAKPSQTTAWLYAIAKKPDGTLFATGTDGVLIKSVNGGDNWSNVVSSTGQTMLDIQFYDNNYGAAVGYAGEMIYTTDGGNNWSIKLMGTPGNITGVWMLSPDTILTVGLEGKMYRTTNAGANFTFSTPGLNDLNSIFFVDDSNGYIAGHQKIYQTSNGGSTWNEMTPYPTANGMKDIFISPDNRVMYAVGDNGSIIKNVNTIGIDNYIDTKINSYPNPVADLMVVPVEGTYTLSVTDSKGAMVQQVKLYEAECGFVDVSALPEGEYFVTVMKEATIYHGRFIVKK
jgi:photosystem II stability/assembly factor-like uncharacterized protein